jgi:hypothetical protein
MLFLVGLVVLLRLALLPIHPVPTPESAEDFSHLLLGDTLTHLRLANPPHPLHQFFETAYVLQNPSYSSIYGLGQGLALAFGQLVFGLPWAGVLLSMAMLSALCYWMLRGWTGPGWAFAGGLVAVCEFGPLNRWMNCYGGGAVSGLAGCLVFGALPRLRRRAGTRDAVLLGLGLGVQMLTCPYESLLLDLSALLFFLPDLRRRDQWPRLARIGAAAALALMPAAVLFLAHNGAVTGNWTTLPSALSRYQYGVPAAFTFQPNPVPHATLTPAQRLCYASQAAAHGPTDTLATFLGRLAGRAGFYRFFLAAPLCLALPFFLPLVGRFRFAWIAATLLALALWANFYPYFFPQCIAAATGLFLLVAVIGLERLSGWKIRGCQAGRLAAESILFLCAANFLFWYGVHALGGESMLRAMAPYETAPGLVLGDPGGRRAIDRRLAEAPGRQLVFVRYYWLHDNREWIHNAADIDSARVVWALELTAEENAQLQRYYPDRTVWLMLPDALPPRLLPYPASTGPFLNPE